MIPFSDLARAAYCPRQLYYARRDDDRDVPDSVRERVDLAFRYRELADAPDRVLRRLPIRRSPAAYRRNLARLRERDDFDHLADPARKRAFVAGKDCHGIVHKVLEPTERRRNDRKSTPDETTPDETTPDETTSDGTPPPVPTLVSPGDPPKNGVWGGHAVRAVAAAKALAWEREREIPRALVEYAAVGAVREVRLTTRRKAAYRRVLRRIRGIDGPPGRVADDRCEPCDYREECGTRTRSLRSLLSE